MSQLIIRHPIYSNRRRNCTVISLFIIITCIMTLMYGSISRPGFEPATSDCQADAPTTAPPKHEQDLWPTNMRKVHDNCSMLPYAKKFNTDDQREHSYYYKHYEPFFCPFKLRNSKFTLIEIGRGYGGGVYFWKTYFPTATIVSLDLQPWHDILPHKKPEEERVHIIQGDQSNLSVVREICNKYNDIDIVIDDGSHHNEHTIITFAALFPCIRNKGVYAIEDTQTSYWYKYGGSCDPHSPSTTVNRLKALLDQQNWAEIESPNPYFEPRGPLADSLSELHFYHNLALIVKGDNTQKSSGTQSLGDKICQKPIDQLKTNQPTNSNVSASGNV